MIIRVENLTGIIEIMNTSEPAEPAPEQSAPRGGDADPEQEPAEIASPAPRTKKIDRGKVSALYNGGWSVEDIAEEMKCSAQTIRNIVKEMGLKR